MSAETFFCYRECRRFPISELYEDAAGNPVHGKPPNCHYLSGNAVTGPSVPPPDMAPRLPEEIYKLLPEKNK